MIKEKRNKNKHIYPVKSGKAGAKQFNGVYFDYSASTPVDSEVLKAMLPYLKNEYGNPSSIHSFGQRALVAIDEAREKVAAFLGCEQSEVVFTGSATEANNLAIRGIVSCFMFPRSRTSSLRGRQVSHRILWLQR